ncbi:ABC transporter permease [Faunimonas sp. B44]|uniref:ABC transporter permease n=1 Tax=Faunimonas sp. B44 TaxID=3461493 RepID=UPI004044BD7B
MSLQVGSVGRYAPLAGLSLSFWRVVVLIGFLVFWEWAANTIIDPFWVSKPSEIAERLWQQASTGMLLVNSAATLWQAALGLALGLPIGVGCGILLAAWPRFAQVVEPFWMGVYSLPRIALGPLFVIWFGIGLLSKVVLVFSLVVFVFMLNTLQGLREVDRDLVNLMRTMRASRSYVLRRVQIPSILPWIIAAFRINVGMALIGSVLGEMLGANRGLGWYIQMSGARLDTAGVFAGLLVLMVMAVVINELIGLIENWLIPYRRNARISST